MLRNLRQVAEDFHLLIFRHLAEDFQREVNKDYKSSWYTINLLERILSFFTVTTATTVTNALFMGILKWQ